MHTTKFIYDGLAKDFDCWVSIQKILGLITLHICLTERCFLSLWVTTLL